MQKQWNIKSVPLDKKLLNLFNNLSDIILTDKTLENQQNKNEEVESRKKENEDDDCKYENEDEDEDYENKNEFEYENKTMSRDKIIKNLSNSLDGITDKSKSFQEQIESIKKLEHLKEYWFMKDFDDKELKFKILKLKLANIANETDENLFETIFGHTLIKLADKLRNTINKEENQIIVKNINKNKDKLFKVDEFGDWVIQANDQHINLLDTIKLILNFNEDQLDLVWMQFHWKYKN